MDRINDLRQGNLKLLVGGFASRAAGEGSMGQPGHFYAPAEVLWAVGKGGVKISLPGHVPWDYFNDEILI
jgi:hypothetical protein